MNATIYRLLIAQFLSAFADNAILFILIELVSQQKINQTGYIPALQSVFLIAPVLFAPWVGNWADHYAKSKILMAANLLKAVGTGLILLKIEPLIAYSIVGAGAALYAPAKYGILPELVPRQSLVKANSWIEASTILAILLGPIIGAQLATISILFALSVTLGLFLISAMITFSLPVFIVNINSNSASGFIFFIQQIRQFLSSSRAKFVVLATALFWATAATLRVIIVAWIPDILNLHSTQKIAEISLFLAIGIMLGAAIVPKLIPLNYLYRVRIPAYLMSLLIICLSASNTIIMAQLLLFSIGLSGGLFIVPINAALQEMGQQSIGSGKAVALQNFFENLAMLFAVGSYTYASSRYELSSIYALFILGSSVFIITAIISTRLPLKSTSSS